MSRLCHVLFCSAVFLVSRAGTAETCTRGQFTQLGSTANTRLTFVGPGTDADQKDAAATSLPAFCRVAGVIAPTEDSRIRFEVWLPGKGWNGRLLGVGNGGFAGSINYGQMASGLRLGFATFSTDTGHQAGAEDASWAYRHPEKIKDYGYRALHLTTLIAKQAVVTYYNRPQEHAYFDSCSNGGREGLMEAQRFPDDFDGILAGAPANNWSRMLSSGIDILQTMTSDPAGYIPGLKLPAIHRAVMDKCDRLDGVEDGIINDPTKCHFEPKSLLCTGEDSLQCLTAPQVRSLAKLYTGGTTREGQPVFPGYAAGSELPGWDYWVVGPGPGAGAGARYPVQFFRYMVTSDPAWDPLRADVSEALQAAIKGVGKDLDATDPDLLPYFSRGGKLLLYHGWDDAAISPLNTIAYYNDVLKTVGSAAAHSIRLYVVPGMEHCSGGPGADRFGQLGLAGLKSEKADALGAIERWVENSQEPDVIIAAKLDPKHTSTAPLLTRPLCPYPRTAHYDGKGDPKQASSFACTSD